ncbi:MAG: methyltransferase domain-containing protein [Planctomycetota bacterium]|jgi:16S rRNA A1518/A1519 N6-dimethyltransferase RsmA/KsgA/DIM1 with predicted DNA glycosylase/AP lyase activity
MLLYYENFRPDFLAHVPIAAKYVLSVGRGAGKTEEELVKRSINVVGVEINPEAAMLARKRGLTVLEGDASEVDISLAGKPYDCLIYADVMDPSVYSNDM